MGIRGGYRPSAVNFRWVPEVGTGHCLEALGGYQMGTDVVKLLFFTPYSHGSAAGENFDVT